MRYVSKCKWNILLGDFSLGRGFKIRKFFGCLGEEFSGKGEIIYIYGVLIYCVFINCKVMIIVLFFM